MLWILPSDSRKSWLILTTALPFLPFAFANFCVVLCAGPSVRSAAAFARAEPFDVGLHPTSPVLTRPLSFPVQERDNLQAVMKKAVSVEKINGVSILRARN